MALVARWFDKTKSFLTEVKVEMKKVTWPTRAQVKNYTVVVIIATFALAVTIGLWDKLMTVLLIQLPGLTG
jgi:preprotein translocase subunit SecE